MLSPHSLECSQTTGSINVADNSDNHNWRSLQDGDSFNHLLLVSLGAGTIHLTDNVSHASLVAHEACEVDWFRGVILWPTFDTSSVGARPLLRQETLGPVTGGLKLSVRLNKKERIS